jgi:hypothetical protein
MRCPWFTARRRNGQPDLARQDARESLRIAPARFTRTGEITRQIGALLGRLPRNRKENRAALGKRLSVMIDPTIIFCVAVAATQYLR